MSARAARSLTARFVELLGMMRRDVRGGWLLLQGCMHTQV